MSAFLARWAYCGQPPVHAQPLHRTGSLGTAGQRRQARPPPRRLSIFLVDNPTSFRPPPLSDRASRHGSGSASKLRSRSSKTPSAGVVFQHMIYIGYLHQGRRPGGWSPHVR